MGLIDQVAGLAGVTNGMRNAEYALQAKEQRRMTLGQRISGLFSQQQNAFMSGSQQMFQFFERLLAQVQSIDKQLELDCNQLAFKHQFLQKAYQAISKGIENNTGKNTSFNFMANA